MPSKLTKQLSPPTPPAFLSSPHPEAVPCIEDLEMRYAALLKLKTLHMERAKLAAENLHIGATELRRIRDRDRGKQRAVEKIKRERDYTPPPDADGSPAKHLLGSSAAPSSARSSVDPRFKTSEELRILKKQKKKRKRELEDSDADNDRPRKSTPPLSHLHGVHPKLPKPSSSLPHPHTKPLAGPDFSIPIPTSLIPARPPVLPPPIAGPSKPSEVTTDFSKSKQPSQVLVTTFYTSVEPYIRPLKEEDIGFLEYTADEVDCYVLPKLGRHYAGVWDEQDIKEYGGPLSGFSPSVTRPHNFNEGSTAPSPKWDPSTLVETDLLGEEKGHGPLTERLVSALLPMPDATIWKGVKAAEDAMEGRPGGSAAAAAKREKINVTVLEERIRDTMRFHGLLTATPDFSTKIDDPIATALRHAQRELRTVVATNKARKERLTAIARDRLGYQEYMDLRDSIDKNISGLYSKLQKKDVPKLAKKKKKVGLEVNGTHGINGASGSGIHALAPHPAALGLNPDEEFTLSLPEQLIQLVETRRQWVDTVGGVFDEKQQESPGRIWGLPKESIFEGIETDIRRSLETSVETLPGEQPKGKEKEKSRGDEMDIG